MISFIKNWMVYDYTMMVVTFCVVGVVVYTLSNMIFGYKKNGKKKKKKKSRKSKDTPNSNATTTSNGGNGNQVASISDAFPPQSKQTDRIDMADDNSSPDVGSNWQNYIMSQ
jgi:hypothetical protein